MVLRQLESHIQRMNLEHYHIPFTKLKWIKDKLITPGPGAYESFSEFHGFDRKNYVKIRKQNIFAKNKNKKSSYSSRATSALTMKTYRQ